MKMSDIVGTPRASKEFWDKLQALVHELGNQGLARYDPVSGPGHMTVQFELLITAGLQASSDLDDASPHGLERRSKELAASSVVVQLFIESKGDESEEAGGYIDLMWRWLRARAMVLSYLCGTLKPDVFTAPPTIEERADLDEEAVLLAQILVGLDNPVPGEFGYPGVFVWLTTDRGPAKTVVYPNWR